jgi:hypothetical protein
MDRTEEATAREAEEPLVHPLLQPACPFEEAIAGDRSFGANVETPRVDLPHRVADSQTVVTPCLEPELLTLSRVRWQVVRGWIGHRPLASLAILTLPTNPARYMPTLIESDAEKS